MEPPASKMARGNERPTLGCPCSFSSSLRIENVTRFSVAMSGEANSALVDHLLRDDRQEDLCFATWKPSSGFDRYSALVEQLIPPRTGERHVHGNASFEPDYLLRAAEHAGKTGRGLVFGHSHPGGSGWQALNSIDRAAEARIARLSSEVTGLPLLGLALAGDRRWSARIWTGRGRAIAPVECESVRVIGDVLSVTFNDGIYRSMKSLQHSSERFIHGGANTQATISRLRVAVAGVGSVGMAIVDLLARTGVQSLGVFDFDSVELINLDRLRGAGLLDAYLMRPKVLVARRLLDEGSTARYPRHEVHELSVCEPEGLSRLLDYDLIISCVDRPWPRHVLNTIAYADLIPVVEGGLIAFQKPDGSLRNAYWRSTIVRPGRPCLACLGQYDSALVQVERDGCLDDPSYIANLPDDSPVRRRENVAAISAAVAAALLQQFVSYVAQPSGVGDPGPLRFNCRDHTVERDTTVCVHGCPYQGSVGCGDARLDPSSRHHAAERARRHRAAMPLMTRTARRVDDELVRTRRLLARTIRQGRQS
ncbi:MAG: hypothetical protein GEU90_18120 [Gemmatimonas sp.]|nr:hypothetical protein [Gemmatimonas sp.]